MFFRALSKKSLGIYVKSASTSVRNYDNNTDRWGAIKTNAKVRKKKYESFNQNSF